VKKIVLIGMPGTLKTSVGKVLAKKLDFDFLDTDEHVESVKKLCITQIFADFGEAYFRELEHSAVLQNYHRTDIVLSAGGGLPLLNENMILLQSWCKVWLQASVQTIYKRLINDVTRPLIAFEKMETIAKMQSDRFTIYKKYADICVQTDNLSVEDIATKIIEEIV
jgi:shikimate kinase